MSAASSRKITALIFFLGCVALLAEDIRTTDGDIFKHATITGHDAIGVTISHSNGVSRVEYGRLPEEIRNKFHYDPRQAQAQADTERKAALQREQALKALQPQKKTEPAADATPSEPDKAPPAEKIPEATNLNTNPTPSNESPASEPQPAATSADFDQYGGWKKIQGQKTGFFHTQKISGRWWLVSPEGNVFFSKGIDSVHPPTKENFRGNDAAVAASFLREWGMNTAGCWSDPDLTKERMAVACRAKITGPHPKDFPDVFDPRWKSDVEREAQSQCAPFRNNPWILGYFIDNERPWKHEDQAEEFVSELLQLPPTSPGHQEALKAKHAGAAAMQAFREKAAELYFQITAAAVRKADPNHMILGCRYAGTPPLSVVKKMKGCADVISINNYSEHPPLKLLREMSQAADLPVIVTEFSFTASGSGLEEKGSGPVKATQSERAMGFEAYVRQLARENYCVGYHWFKYGETWQGVLQSDGNPWPELTRAFANFNRTAESLHLQAGGH